MTKRLVASDINCISKGFFLSQWEMKLEDGRMIYVRYKHGYLSLAISDKPTDDVWDAVGNDVFIYGQHLDDGFQGALEQDKLVELTCHLIDYSKV